MIATLTDALDAASSAAEDTAASLAALDTALQGLAVVAMTTDADYPTTKRERRNARRLRGWRGMR